MKLTLRISDELAEHLKREAEANCRSLNSEIAWRLGKGSKHSEAESAKDGIGVAVVIPKLSEQTGWTDGAGDRVLASLRKPRR